LNDQHPEYKPGDVINGHILTADGAWLPIAQAGGFGGGPPSGPPGAPGRAQYGSGNNNPVVFVQAENSNNTSLAPITSLVSGLIGLFLCWIPIIGIVGWILGPVAITFGLFGLGRGKAEHKVMSWIGIVCGYRIDLFALRDFDHRYVGQLIPTK
jgi:hypothetical protein